MASQMNDLIEMLRRVDERLPRDVISMIAAMITSIDMKCIAMAMSEELICYDAFTLADAIICAQHGYVDLIRLFPNGHIVAYFIFSTAIMHGNEAMIDWCMDTNSECNWNSNTMSQLALYGHIALLKKVVNSSNMFAGLVYHAVKGGHVEMFRWLQEILCPWNVSECLELAAQVGNIDMLVELKSRTRLQSSMYIAAIAEKKWEVVKWLCVEKVHMTVHIPEMLVRRGELDMLIWVRTRGCQWDEKTFDMAVRTRDFDCMEYLHASGAPHDGLCVYAAQLNKLDVLQWLRARGYPWDIDACYQYAGEEMKKWIDTQM